ncbi:uncharacterized protein LOC121700575 [Alosa sapidissima]|uniref:uncharacterized protein LOC121700575 n=1 Tax=Alosa sapidissima TaxID=34773 RepID=UPI001C083418|nr:uncharacterized protein LOC121700575 [Alosa sapidissima]
MSEGNEPKKKCSVEPRAECSSTKRTTNIDADQDHVNLSPMVRHLVENMTEEHWRIVCEALHVPGTKEDFCQLCACIVAKVVRTTHYYLITALRKVLGVPVTYVIPCGTARVCTSDTKKARELSLGQGNLRIRDEMLLAAAHKKVDEILQESVRIANGLQPAVPVLIEGPMRAEHAKASGLSLSIPLLDQLTGTEFRKRATEQVSEVLLNTLDSDSCLESPAEVFAKDDHESNTKAESQTDLCELPAFYPPGTHSQSVADDLVGDVIDSMNEDSGQNIHLAAYDVVGYVVAGMKDLVETTRVMGGVSMRRIYATSQTMFSAIQNAVRKLFSRSVYSNSKEETTMASAIHVISQVILFMQCELSDLKSAEDLEQIALIQKILSALLSEVRMIGMETKKDRSQSPQLPSPHFLRSADREIEDPTKLHGTPVPPEVIVNMEGSSLSPACANEAIAQVVDTVLEGERLVPVPIRLEKLISESKMWPFSHDIADQVQKIIKSSHGLQTISVPAGKSLSDSILCKLPARAERQNEAPSGFIYGYVEEAVKRLVSSCLFPSASSEDQERSQQNLETSTSSCILNMFTEVMVKEVMVTLSTEFEGNAASANSDDFKKLVREDQKLLDKQPQDTEMTSSTTNSNYLPQNSECEAVIFSSHLPLSESNKNDYASLVSMLVIRLLKKVDSSRPSIGTHQDGVPDKVLDISRELIQKILCELDTSFGITSDESHPQQVNFHLMYRNVYKDLTREFGSEDVLCSALESQDQSFESFLVEKLTGEIIKTCSQTNSAASAALPPIQAVTGLQENNKEKTKKKMTPSWLKMPTFNWKKSKNGAHSLLDSEGSLVPSTSSSQVQAMKTELRQTLAEVTKAPACAAGRLEMAQKEETAGCCFFRMPKFKFSFKPREMRKNSSDAEGAVERGSLPPRASTA